MFFTLYFIFKYYCINTNYLYFDFCFSDSEK